MLESIAIYLLFGAIAGVVAGLLGVGGGLIIVPIITYAFVWQGIDSPYNHHMALATSLASIIFTSVSSFLAHHKNKAVIWPVVKQISAGILIGTFLGAQFAKLLPPTALKIVFVVFLYYVATQMLANFKPKPTRELPKVVGNSIAGLVIGIMSSLVGIGGGSLSVPYMTWCNVPIRKAIGTSAAIGFPIALAGTAGFIWAGLSVTGLPEYHLGFVYLPALLGIASASVCTAPFGAKLAHTLPIATLKRYFAFLLYAMGTQMLYKVFF